MTTEQSEALKLIFVALAVRILVGRWDKILLLNNYNIMFAFYLKQQF